MRNRCYVEGCQINFKKHLTDYIKCENQFISKVSAKKLANHYYDKFYKDYGNEIANKPVEDKTIGGMAI